MHRLIAPSLVYRSARVRTLCSHAGNDFMILLPGSEAALLPWRYPVSDVRSLRLRRVNSTRRPELSPKDVFYSRDEVKRYLSKSKNILIQQDMTERAVSLLIESGKVDRNDLILDLGCGACISGKVLRSYGFRWIGLDLSHEMLKRRRVPGLALIRGDMFGSRLPFVDSAVKCCISISALQWAFRYESTIVLEVFFGELWRVLDAGGIGVVQFYPSNSDHVETVLESASSSNFLGCLVATHPHGSSALKLFLCLMKSK